MKHRLAILTVLGVICLLPRVSQAATLSLAPAAGQVQVGQTMTATVRVNAAGTAVNAAEATVSFPSDLLKLTAVSKSGSIFKFWTVEPSGSNTSARIIFSGGLPSPGYSGSAGTIIKISWQAMATGTASVKMTGGKVLANDGLGTNVLTAQSGATYTVMAGTSPSTSSPQPSGPVTPTVSSSDFSSEQGWYSGSQATLLWTKPGGLEGVSYGLTRAADSVPDETLDSNSGTTTVNLTDDGVWYFHLRGKYASGWSGTRHFKLQRDTTAPESFEIRLTRDRGLADPSPTLTFATTDVLSGVSGYTASLNGQPGVPVTSPYTLTAEQAGEYHVIITATDGAGNTRDSDISFSVEGYTAPVLTFVSTPLILLENLVVRGTAQAGDRVNIFIDGELLGSTYAGAANLAVTDGTIVRLPWVFTSEKPLGPGGHRITATVTSADGQTSLATDPVTLAVRGRMIEFNGRPIATFAAVPLFGLFVILFTTLIAVVMTRLWLITRRLERRESIVDQELKELKTAMETTHLSDQALEEAISMIDDDLVGRRRQPKHARRRTKKST